MRNISGNRRKICLCTDSLEPSGVGEHMLALATALSAAWDITLAAPPNDRELLSRAAALGLVVRELPMLASGIEDWFARAGFSLVHVHAGIGWEGHGLARGARAAGVPFLVRTEHLPYLLTDPEEKAAHAEGVAQVDRVICVSRAVAASHHQAGIDPGKIIIIRNGIAPAMARRSRAEVRATLGLSGQKVIVTVARLSAQKGHRTLLDAAPEVLSAHPDACFLLVGTGPEEIALRKIVQRKSLGASVRFLGRRDDVPDLLAAADLLLLPSLFEGLPLVVLEAMAAGLAVVATRIGGTEEAVADGITGRLFGAGDAAELARCVTGLLADPAAAAAAGTAGEERFRREFQAARMAGETHGLYVAGLRSLSAISSCNPGAAMSRVHIGFIGAGGIAQRHLGVLEQFDDVEIAAIADTQPGRAAEVARRFGARAYDSHAEMLAAQKLDAVFICVPPFAHGAPERDVLRRGLPFFVEKPLSADLGTAEAIAREVAAAGIITGVGYHWRYLDTVEEARALLAQAPAQLVSGYWLDATPPPEWWWKQTLSGGQIVEQATHILDLARYLVGEVEQVFGLIGHLQREPFPGLDVATASSASLKFASGAVGSISATCVLKWGHRIGLHLFSDGLAIELSDREIMVDRGRGRPVRTAKGDPVWHEDRDFIDAVKGLPDRIRCSYREALQTHRLALAIARSAAQETPVQLAQGREMENV